ncbi:hypothetical protein I7G59_19895 [Sinorhizobium meliloti]|uniref:ABC-three component system protein n=1 Tax=Rhizobium meliloti TaxID=382 RepID=UPI0023A1D83B|nr:hypothetical protein [Sinorhizobium meliloti]
MENAITRLLRGNCRDSSNQENEAGYKALYDLTPETRREMLELITVLDASPDNNDMAGEIEQEVFHAATAEHRPLMIERLEGWWFAQVIVALSSAVSKPISVAALDDKIDKLRESFQRTNLPVDFADAHPPSENITDLDGRAFVRQLRKIEVNAKRIEWAVRDYCRAFEQRARCHEKSSLLLSIHEVARQVSRDVHAVNRDVATLLNSGVIDRTPEGVEFPYDRIHFEFGIAV